MPCSRCRVTKYNKTTKLDFPSACRLSVFARVVVGGGSGGWGWGTTLPTQKHNTHNNNLFCFLLLETPTLAFPFLSLHCIFCVFTVQSVERQWRHRSGCSKTTIMEEPTSYKLRDLRTAADLDIRHFIYDFFGNIDLATISQLGALPMNIVILFDYGNVVGDLAW